MFRIRYRARRLFLLPLIIIILITFTLIVINNSLLRHVFYNYQITFHGIPGSYLSTKTPNESYCNFRYGLPEELLYEESDLIYPLEERSKSYRILENVIEAKWDKSVPEVTYSTHATADFIDYIAEVVRFWEGPLSVAAFVPDFDADLTISQLNQLCHCVPEMGRVSVHFVFPLNSPPYLQNHQGQSLSCELPDSSKLATFRGSNELMYPINVCRNIARNYAQTDFVLVTDIQLIPSENLASGFMKMVKKFKIKANPPSRVFVVPVFEVEAFDVIPRRKDELVMMVREERAVYFHRHICSHCQKFPGIKTWLESGSGNVKPFVSVKREYPFHRWEPIYIGSRNDPLYSEALSWEGLQDKMTQMLEMCLIGYQFVILDGAFLVHWPGIKREKHKFLLKDSWRSSFQQLNSKQYSKILNDFKEKYEDNPKCKLQ